MSNEIEITVKGWVGQRPRLVDTRSGAPMMTMRVGSTPRRRDPAREVWVDGETTWFSVLAFGDLADNASRSLRKGDPVLVRGRLSVKRTESDGREFVNAEIVADAIGPELARGTALYSPVVHRPREEPATEAAAPTESAPRPQWPEPEPRDEWPGPDAASFGGPPDDEAAVGSPEVAGEPAELGAPAG